LSRSFSFGGIFVDRSSEDRKGELPKRQFFDILKILESADIPGSDLGVKGKIKI